MQRNGRRVLFSYPDSVPLLPSRVPKPAEKILPVLQPEFPPGTCPGIRCAAG